MLDLTQGSPLKVILRFAVPLYIGQVFQLAYGIIDSRIIGSFLGTESLAAVGAVTTLVDFTVLFLNGFINGFGIIIALFFGAKDSERMKKSIAWTTVLGFAIAFATSFLCLLFHDPILKVLNIQDQLLAPAKNYSRVIIGGLFATAAYNICASILRSAGDSVTPLIFLIFSNLLNGILDFVLVKYTAFGVVGAAYATVAAQTVSAVVCFVYMRKKHPSLNVGAADFSFSPDIFRQLISTGFSMSVMMSFVQLGTVVLQTAINTFGANTIVAHTTARKIGFVFMTPFSVFGSALATYCSQNLGAGKNSRIKSGISASYVACLVWWGFSLAVINLCAPLFVRLVSATENQEIIATATTYLRVNSAMYFVPAAISILRNSMQGFGDRKTPLFSSFIELALKVIFALIFAPRIGYWAIIICEPILWCVMVIPLIIGTFRFPALKTAVNQQALN